MVKNVWKTCVFVTLDKGWTKVDTPFSCFQSHATDLSQNSSILIFICHTFVLHIKPVKSYGKTVQKSMVISKPVSV